MSSDAIGAGRRRGPLEPEIRRYAKPYRKRLRKLAKSSSRLGDLIVSFPAAAFAMVSNRGPAEARGAAVRLVKEGAPLPAVAEALGLPVWTRWLAPEAFQAPLGALETDAAFDRQIANQVRRAAGEQAMWLDWLQMARRYGDDAFALWLARQDVYGAEPTPAEAVIPLAAFAWHSARPDAPARAQAVKLWHGKMGFASAAAEARQWLTRALRERCRKPMEVRGGWWRAQSVSGFKVSPRDTKALLEQEGRAMNNCVATYWDKVRLGESMIYGIRRGGSPVATMEIRADPKTEGRAVITELLGPGNVPTSAKVWSAAMSWLAKQGPSPLRPRGRVAIGAVDPPRWNETWAAYRADRPEAALFAPDPSAEALYALEQGYAALARAAK